MHTRRAFLATSTAAAGLAGAAAEQPVEGLASLLMQVDHRKLVSRADLLYDKPAPRSEAGMPVGNGRTGSLVWTTPTAMRLQINRADLYSSSCASNSFNERHNDFCGGCGFVDIDFGGYGDDVFPDAGFPQRLSIYDGLLTISGKGVTSKVLGWPSEDVIAVSIDDQRTEAGPVSVDLRMLRFVSKHPGAQLEAAQRDRLAIVQTRSHTATSQLHIRGNRIALTQEFREARFYSKSAVVIEVVGRKAKPHMASESTVRLAASPGRGEFRILIASASTFDANEDVLAIAERRVTAAAARPFASLAQETADWWHRFWARGYVHISSTDGVGDYVERNYHYFLYLMASTSRGKYPPKFNGMLWNTGGDLRAWGAQHWFANLSCYYEAIPAANRYDLMDPVFNMYSAAHQSCAVAARQEWGSRGAYIPETMYFDGLEELPEEIAAEMRELYLMRKPWEQRSQKFMEYSQYKHPHSSRWNWIAKTEWVNGRFVETERGSGPYGNVSHILGTSAKVPYLYWRRYEYSLDQAWLHDRAYPMIKGAAEFYRNFPNLSKEADGKYHIRFVNSNEGIWGARDTDEDLASLRGILAAAIRASEILGADPDLRELWKDLMTNLTPLPVSSDPDALIGDNYQGPRVWVRGRKPAVKGGGGFGTLPDGNSMPAWFFDLCSVESTDRELLELANNTLTACLHGQPGPDTPVGLLSKLPMAAASLGRAEAVRFLIPNQMRGLLRAQRGGVTPPDASPQSSANLANRMSLREGPQALDAEAFGRASEALHLALMQSNPPGPAHDPIIHLFPAWPKGWDAAFTLLARGAFLVTSSIRKDQVEFVELESQAGVECRLRNPWGESAVTLFREGGKAETLSGSLLSFATRKGEKVTVVPGGSSPRSLKRSVPA